MGFAEIKNKVIKSQYFFLVGILFCLMAPSLVKAQTESSAPPSNILGPDTLLREFLFPVSSYEPAGNPILERGIECEGYKLYDQTGDYNSCKTLPAADSPEDIRRQSSVSGSILIQKPAKLSYKFTVADQADYIFSLSAANSADSFSQLTRQQIDYIDSQITGGIAGALNSVGEGFTYTSDQKYDLYRSLIFSVYVDGEDEANKQGFITVKSTKDKLQGSVLIGNLAPGDHTIYLHFLSDFYFDFKSLWLPGLCKGTDVDGHS